MSRAIEFGTIALINNREELFDAYCRPTSGHPWPLYDIDPAPHVLSGPDLCSPALLSYSPDGHHFNAMSAGGSEHARLVAAMRAVIAHTDGPVFWRLPQSRIDELAYRQRHDELPNDQFGAFVHVLDLVQDISGLTSVYVTKVLHRKRPRHIPIKDSLLSRFYGVADDGYAELFAAIHRDVNNNHGLLRDLTLRAERHAAHPMSLLRALDIVVWMHMKENGEAD